MSHANRTAGQLRRSIAKSIEALPIQLKQIVEDIYRCLDHDLPYPALLLSLTIPEICMGCTLTIESFVRKSHYDNFLEKYVDERIGINKSVLYAMRGGLIHRGSTVSHPYQPYSQIVFSLGIEEDKHKWHGFSWFDGEFPPLTDQNAGQSFDDPFFYKELGSEPRSFLYLEDFCHELIKGLLKWYDQEGRLPQVIKNLSQMMRYSEDGTGTMLRGGPVIFFGEVKTR